MHRDDFEPIETGAPPSRRSLLTWIASFTMLGAVGAAYGGFAAMLGRFFYPARPARSGWLFVRQVAGISPGQAIPFRLPNGSPVHITRRVLDTARPPEQEVEEKAAASEQTAQEPLGDEARAFVALSSTCPHLGCQVHWQAHHDRFFCPCHNGIFNAEGTAISGPPADAGQSLIPYPLRVRDGMLFIRVPLDSLAENANDHELERG